MYITQEADYAVRIVHCLAKSGGRRDARSISEEVSVTLRFSLKILGKLSGAGIVNSFKGNRGGYELAAKPEEITMQQVLAAVDGPYYISRCSGGSSCNRGDSIACPFHHVFNRISDSVNTQLQQVTFRDLMNQEQLMAANQ